MKKLAVGKAGYIDAYMGKYYLMKSMTKLLWIISVQIRMLLQSLVRS